MFDRILIGSSKSDPSFSHWLKISNNKCASVNCLIEMLVVVQPFSSAIVRARLVL